MGHLGRLVMRVILGSLLPSLCSHAKTKVMPVGSFSEPAIVAVSV